MTLRQMPTSDQVCFELNVLLMRVMDHILKAAVRGKVRALEVMDMEGSTFARPKTKSTLPQKSAKAG